MAIRIDDPTGGRNRPDSRNYPSGISRPEPTVRNWVMPGTRDPGGIARTPGTADRNAFYYPHNNFPRLRRPNRQPRRTFR